MMAWKCRISWPIVPRCFLASSSGVGDEVKKGRKLTIDLAQYRPAFSIFFFCFSEKIRNFGIVAHVDHGKSTLADRLLEITGVLDKKCHAEQVLDKLQVERDRGITVKAQTCSMFHKVTSFLQTVDFLLNLIDTPGHADFSFEVSRSLAATSGIVLLVAANQGVQAQTVMNFWIAFEAGLTVIPVINKIDLNSADVPRVFFILIFSF
ncbi:unnamed protein product, partial [Gongylonema pulchrum]|uniref:Tr-type G domain-containing protein n=1 Tax=Gongylonema pulchrum TaxID=637853 RepID=A0A183EF60_9BILA